MNKEIRDMAIESNVDPKFSAEIAVFVDKLIDRCATIAEEQARVFSGEKNEAIGCYSAANAIRLFGKNDNL